MLVSWFHTSRTTRWWSQQYKNVRFWYKCVSRWVWDFPGAVGELFPCPVYTLLSLVPGQVGRLTYSHSSKRNIHNRSTYFHSGNGTELENILKTLPWNMQRFKEVHASWQTMRSQLWLQSNVYKISWALNSTVPFSWLGPMVPKTVYYFVAGLIKN